MHKTRDADKSALGISQDDQLRLYGVVVDGAVLRKNGTAVDVPVLRLANPSRRPLCQLVLPAPYTPEQPGMTAQR